MNFISTIDVAKYPHRFQVRTINPAIMDTTSEKRLSVRQFIIRKTTTYAVVCAFLTFVNLSASPHCFWAKWILAGWGLQLFLSCFCYWQDNR